MQDRIPQRRRCSRGSCLAISVRFSPRRRWRLLLAHLDMSSETAFGGRPVLVCGDWLGGTVTLALANPSVGRLVLDPPLRTADLWPLRKFVSDVYAERPQHRQFFENLLGFRRAELWRPRLPAPGQENPARIVTVASPLMPELAAGGQPDAKPGWGTRARVSSTPCPICT